MANKGNYYKRKTKKYLEEKGYFVEYIEKYQRFFNKKKNQVGHIKKDLFGADMLAMNEEEIIFVQAKFNVSQVSSHVAEAIKEFNKYPFPDFVDRWVVVWTPRVREPQIVDLNQVEMNRA